MRIIPARAAARRCCPGWDVRRRLSHILSGVTVPLHPGAERYYRNVGIMR